VDVNDLMQGRKKMFPMQKIPRFTFRIRLLLPVFIVLIPALILTIYTSIEGRQREKTAVQNSAVRLAHIFAAHEQDVIEATKEMIVTIAHDPRVRQQKRLECNKFLTQLLEHMGRYSNIEIADSGGTVISSAIALAGRSTIADQDYFREAMKTEDFALGEYQAGRIEDKPAINLAYPIVNEKGRKLGVVVAAMELEKLGNLETWLAAQLPEGSTLTMIDRNGTILTQYPDRYAQIGHSISELLHTRSQFSGVQGIVWATDSKGIQQLYVYSQIESRLFSIGMTVILSIPEDLAFGNVNDAFHRNLVFLSLAGLLVLLASAIASELYLVRGLAAIRDAALQLAIGNLHARVGQIQGFSEVKDLGKSFNEMIGLVEQRENESQRSSKIVRESEARYRALIQKIHVAVVVYGVDTQIIISNPMAQKLLGLAEDQLWEEAAFKPVWHFMHEDGTAMPLEKFPVEEVLASRKALRNLIVRLHNPRKATDVWVLINADPLFDNNDEITQVILTLIDITELKRTQEKLQLSNVILSTQQEASIDGILVVDDNAEIVSCNHRFVEMWDLPPELIGKKTDEPVLKFVSSKVTNSEAFLRQVRHLYRHKGEISKEEIVLTNGKILERYTAPMIGADGHYYGRVWFFHDITERIQFEDSLKKQNDEFETIFNLVPAQIWYKDWNNNIVRVNSTACKDIGMTPDKIEGHSAEELFPAYAKQYYESDLAVLSTGEPLFGIIERINTATGDHIWVHTDKVPVFGKAGNVTGLIAFVKDITDVMLADEALRESDARFRQIAENIQEVFFLVEKEDNKLLYISPSIMAVFGFSQEMMHADRTLIERVVYQDDLPHVEFIHPERFYSASLDEEFRIIKPSDGKMRWVRLRSVLIHNEQGDVIRVAGLVADITDLRITQDEANWQHELLLQADKMASLGVLVSGIAHEINNPNNLIMFNSDLLSRMTGHLLPILDEYYDAHPDQRVGGFPYYEMRREINKLLSGITIGSHRICDIVAGLKEFARMDTGSLNQEIRINDVVKSALLIVRNLINKSTDQFSEEYNDHLPAVRGNIQQIEQVIINLFTNACQALPDRGRAIHVRTETDGKNGMVRVVVSDEGVGISKENMKKIFDPFFTTKREHGGTGLGLSVSYKIIQAHNGMLRIDSVEGKGTVATLSLPVPASTEVL
jgi:PAS domain S-box-containing protein